MPKSNFLILDNFYPGWHKRDDDSRIPIGGAQTSSNITLTTRGGIAPRQGETLVGDADAGGNGKSLYSFKKSSGDPLLIKTFDDRVEFYSNKKSTWALVKEGFTSGQRFDFDETRVDVNDTLDWVSFGNGVDPFHRWCGYDAYLTQALVGGETEVLVDTTLTPDVHYTGTASASTATTITIATSDWANDIWNDNFYVRITSGAKTGFISKITGTTATGLVFGSIASLTGAVTFEIRQVAVPATGTLIYNETTLAYTAVPRDDRFTVGSAHASAGSDDVVTIAPTSYPQNPKGNLFAVINEALYVSGYAGAPVTVSRSHIADTDNFTISSPRAANEGDLVYFPYGGKQITDIQRWESALVVFKEDSIDALTYSQAYDGTLDAQTDVAVIDPIKVGVASGSVGRTWIAEDDIMFATPDNRITALSRVASKDVRPQTADIGYNIRREIANYNFDTVAGIEHINEVFVSAKTDTGVANNNRLLVWNKDYKTWEGYWNIQAADLVPHNGGLYYLDSYSPDVYQMFTGTNKTKGEVVYPMDAIWKSGWINGRGTAFYLNEVSCLAVEGRIRLNTTIIFRLYKDYASDSFVELALTASENEDILDGESPVSLLGGDPLGLQPLGGQSLLGAEESDGYRHFVAFIDFPITQIEYVAIEVSSSGTSQAWEVTRLGLNVTENIFESQPRIITQ